MFFSLSVSWGGLIMFGSYNKFKTRVHIHATLISSLDFVTSIIAGVVVFSILGHLSCKVTVITILFQLVDLLKIFYVYCALAKCRISMHSILCYSLEFQSRVSFGRSKGLRLWYILKPYSNFSQLNCGLCFSSSCYFCSDWILSSLFSKLF